MMRVEVRLERDCGPITVGHLLDAGQQIHFEYAPPFLSTGLELSPLRLPLGPGVRSEGLLEFHGLYGLFYDSLPDGWGLLLMHRRMRERGVDPHRISVLAWLRHLGMRTMGALTYHPAEGPAVDAPLEVELSRLASEAVAVFEGRTESVLPELELAGGSPGGARPKVVIGLGPDDQALAGSDTLPPGFEHWLVKFSARDDRPDASGLEEVYMRMARACGLRTPQTTLLPLPRGRRCFATRRFDREGAARIHMHTLGGLLHASHRVPSVDYLDVLNATMAITRSQAELEEAFRRLCFNVLACNRDDHVRNFSFVMSPAGEWSISPAYDLIYSEGMRGHHTTSVSGQTLAPTAEAVLALADEVGIPRGRALELVDVVSGGVGRFTQLARAVKLDPRTLAHVAGRLREVKAQFGPLPRSTPRASPGRSRSRRR